MSVKERLTELQLHSPDSTALRVSAYERDAGMIETLRLQQATLFTYLKKAGIVASIEQFIGEEIPSLEEHQQRFSEWINSLPKDPMTERPELPDSEIGKWRLSMPWPKQDEYGRWDRALHIDLTRVTQNSPRKWEEAKFTYDEQGLVVIKGEWVTLARVVNPPVNLESSAAVIEQALAEAVYNPSNVTSFYG